MLLRTVLLAFLLTVPAAAYEIREVFISEIDAWGIPKLLERASTNSIPGNVLKELHKLYKAPNFLSQKEDVFEKNDLEGIIVLCAMWAYVVPADERACLRNEIIEKTLKIDLDKVKYVGELFSKESFSKSFKLDPRLNLFLGVLLFNKFGRPIPAIGNDVDVHGMEAKASLALRTYMIGVTAGDLDDFSCFGEAFRTFIFLLAKSQYEKDRSKLFFWVEACEFGDFSLLRANANKLEEIAKRLGASDPGVRLARALLKKNSAEFDAEISLLSASFFPPAYPFMEEICRKTGRFSDAAYFRYLTMRSPWKANKLIEFPPSKGVIKNLLMPRSEQFFYDLIRAGYYDDVYSFGTYTIALLRQSPEMQQTGRSLYEKISRDLIQIGREASFKDISYANKRIRNEGYINHKFEARYQKALLKLE